MDDEHTKVLSHYRLIEKIGEGGMGVVWKAEDTVLHRTVAVKVLPPEVLRDERRRRMFLEEARMATKVSDAHIAHVYEFGRDDDLDFIAMEYVDGEPLSNVIHGRPLELDRVVLFGLQISRALSRAHHKGLIHRDLKPANVLITADGDVKIVDFGLATLYESDRVALSSDDVTIEAPPADSNATVPPVSRRRLVGTLPYMSSEQVQGKELDARSDVFSLGVILYEMSTGRRPFSGETPQVLVDEISRARPTPIQTLAPKLPLELGRIIQKALAARRGNRYQSMDDLAVDLKRLQRDIESGSSPSYADLARGAKPKDKARKRWRWIAGAAVVAVLGASAIWFGLSGDTPSIQNLEARRTFDQARQYEAREAMAHLRTAERMYRRSLELEPDNAFLEAHLARFLADREYEYPTGEERMNEIRALADHAVSTDDGLGPAWVARARLSLLEGDVGAAVVSAERAVETSGNAFEGYMVLGEARIAEGAVDAGLRNLRKAIEVGEGHIRARSRLARELYNLGRLDEAAAEYRRVLEYAPDSTSALNNLAVIHLARGNYVESIELLNRLLEIEPDDFAASNLGSAYFYLNRMDQALEAYHRAVELAPTDPLHKQNLAEAYEKAGDGEAARRWYSEALPAYDDLLRDLGEGLVPETLAERAFCAAKLDRFDEARDNIARASARQPDNMFVLRSAARVHAMAGDRETSFDFIRRAVAAGYPREELHRDAAFEPYRSNREFLELLTEPLD